MYIIQIPFSYCLQPYTLPDSGSACVENAGAFLLPELLSSGHLQIRHTVLGHYHNGIFPFFENLSNLHLKADMPAFMKHHKLPVYPHPAKVIHRPKVKQDSFPLHRFRQGKIFAVPNHIALFVGANPGKLRLIHIRHNNFPVKAVLLKGKLPFSV